MTRSYTATASSVLGAAAASAATTAARACPVDGAGCAAGAGWAAAGSDWPASPAGAAVPGSAEPSLPAPVSVAEMDERELIGHDHGHREQQRQHAADDHPLEPATAATGASRRHHDPPRGPVRPGAASSGFVAGSLSITLGSTSTAERRTTALLHCTYLRCADLWCRHVLTPGVPSRSLAAMSHEPGGRMLPPALAPASSSRRATASLSVWSRWSPSPPWPSASSCAGRFSPPARAPRRCRRSAERSRKAPRRTSTASSARSASSSSSCSSCSSRCPPTTSASASAGPSSS